MATGKWKKFKDGLRNFGKKLWGGLKKGVKVISDVFNKNKEGIKQGVKGVVSLVAPGATSFVDAAVDLVADGSKAIVGGDVGAMANTVKQGVKYVRQFKH